MFRGLPASWLSVALLGAALICAGPGAQAAESAKGTVALPEKKFEVQVIRDVAYYEGPDADPVKHKLDLYLPRGHKDFPVVFFVHGGAWMHGDKNYFGLYSALGTFYARRGIGVVVTNYRLSPKVKHPEHIKDVARAFAWTWKNIEKYGGKKECLFVSGHSAGGHLVSLLATDGQYLKAEGLTPKAIRGVMAISGVYAIPERFLDMVFGTDPEARKLAGPIEHIHPELPPFLILYADKDLPKLGEGAEAFGKCLLDKKCQAEIREVKNRGHSTILLCSCLDDDPAAVALLTFVTTHAK
jgi:acetyl esterase/lipase